MIKYARILHRLIRLMALSLSLAMATAYAADADPPGEWLVHDGSAHIRILACDKALWGIISWVSQPDTDRHNPDIARQNRPLLGLPILLAMREDGANRWDGNIYNADNGKIYHGNISLKSPDLLHVEGCLLHGMLCGGEDWTRLGVASHGEDTGRLCRALLAE